MRQINLCMIVKNEAENMYVIKPGSALLNELAGRSGKTDFITR